MSWDITNTRVFPVARERLFEAIADPAQLAQWWGPHGFTSTFHQFEFRPGGPWRLTMHAPDGADYPNESEFIEITHPERIVFIHHRPMHRYQMTMTLQPEGEGTRLSWLMAFDADEGEAMRGFITAANEENFDRLGTLLAKASDTGRDVRLSRFFPASREALFRAWTDPQQIAHWWGRHDFTNPQCQFDAHPGGRLTIVMRSAEGVDYPLHGRVSTIEAPRQLGLDFDLSAYPAAWRQLVCSGLPESDAAQINTHQLHLTFTEHDGGTRLDLRLRFPTPAVRAAFVRHGLNEGWAEGLDSLAALLARSQPDHLNPSCSANLALKT